MAVAGGGEEKNLEQTPSWVVAVVCSVFVIASLLLERAIHTLGKYFKRNKQKELFHTLEQIRNELMLLGFISLLLTVFQPRVASICIAESLSHKMLPCPYEPVAEGPAAEVPVAARRRLFAAEAPVANHCKAGQVQAISVEGLHQLHIFIFVLACVHVFYSCVTVLIGLLQVHSWKKWEDQARQKESLAADEAIKTKHHRRMEEHMAHQEHDAQFTEGRLKYRFLHQSRTGLNLDAYIYSFFRQFGKPIYKSDYLRLRMGFIAKHGFGASYDFHSYIRRTMEQDFKRVVGISAYLWAFVCLFLLLDVDGWYTYFWIAFIPTILVLIVGAKLQHIILELALKMRGGVQKLSLSTLDDLDDDFKKPEQHSTIAVKPLVPDDDLFWFKRPSILIMLIHFILFQNAFELAFFFWAMFSYGFNSCLVGKRWMICVRLGLGVFVQILCSASTLPLYALVSQMGETLRVNFTEDTEKKIQNWHAKATKKKDHNPRISHKLGGIVGLTKYKDEQGHVRDIELPPHHKLTHDGEHHPQHHVQHPQHHAHPHPHQDGESHSVEIHQTPLIITNKNPSDSSNNQQAPPKTSGFANLAKLAAAKEKEKKDRDPESNGEP